MRLRRLLAGLIAGILISVIASGVLASGLRLRRGPLFVGVDGPTWMNTSYPEMIGLTGRGWEVSYGFLHSAVLNSRGGRLTLALFPPRSRNISDLAVVPYAEVQVDNYFRGNLGGMTGLAGLESHLTGFLTIRAGGTYGWTTGRLVPHFSIVLEKWI